YSFFFTFPLQYKPDCAITKSDPKYRSNPTLGDRVHCIVYVINCRHIAVLQEHVLAKYKNVRQHISNEGIPQVAILTHCEEACAEVGKDVTNVYKSKYINEKSNDFKHKLGIPLNTIFPVKNYATTAETDTNMDILLLSPFKHMLDFAGDFIKNSTIVQVSAMLLVFSNICPDGFGCWRLPFWETFPERITSLLQTSSLVKGCNHEGLLFSRKLNHLLNDSDCL
uniref:interferon-induced protein 44-like n=1 Tax=Myxine glutinosa TaxID=7769 RepID=UPI00358E32B4